MTENPKHLSLSLLVERVMIITSNNESKVLTVIVEFFNSSMSLNNANSLEPLTILCMISWSMNKPMTTLLLSFLFLLFVLLLCTIDILHFQFHSL